jgi:hypothetical protein
MRSIRPTYGNSGVGVAGEFIPGKRCFDCKIAKTLPTPTARITLAAQGRERTQRAGERESAAGWMRHQESGRELT